MQQFKSRGKIYNLPDSATHAASGACLGVYYKDGGQWFFIRTTGEVHKSYGTGFYASDVVELKPKRNPFAFWNKIKGAMFK